MPSPSQRSVDDELKRSPVTIAGAVVALVAFLVGVVSDALSVIGALVGVAVVLVIVGVFVRNEPRWQAGLSALALAVLAFVIS